MKILLCVSVLLVAHAEAQLVRQPADVQPGDQYRLMFLTSTVRDGSSSDIDDYNVFVQATADAAPIVGWWALEWRAAVSTRSMSARDNTQTNYTIEEGLPIYRLDGELVWRDNVNVWEDEMSHTLPPVNPLNFTELGTTPEHTLFWSGSWADGSSPPQNPGGVGSVAMGGEGATVGATDVGLWYVDVEVSPLEFPFIAISEVLTAVEPGDVNGDGNVDFGDFTILADHFGEYGPLSSGEISGDGVVDFNDFLILSSNYGVASAIPEPSAQLLVLVALLGTLWFRSRPCGIWS